MKITIEVPDGEFCRSCQFLRNFEIEEIEATSHDDTFPRYIRGLKANCYLFRKFVRGDSLRYMNKCPDCVRKGESND